MDVFLHEDVEGQVQGAELRRPQQISSPHIHLRAATDPGLDGLLGPDPRRDVADGHDNVHAVQRHHVRHLPRDAARRTCRAARAERELTGVSSRGCHGPWLQLATTFKILVLTAGHMSGV